jgi:hypothetical protein
MVVIVTAQLWSRNKGSLVPVAHYSWIPGSEPASVSSRTHSRLPTFISTVQGKTMAPFFSWKGA